MTRIGILSDPHLGFSRYTKVNEKSVNTREADFYAAFVTAVENLCNADVEAIVCLGDIADNPHPKKRALRVLIDTINASGLPWWDVNGNHTLVRHSTDNHLHDLLEAYCKRFTGIREASWVEPLRAVLVPYGTADEITAGLSIADSPGLEPAFIGGHFACSDVLPDGHDINVGDLPTSAPTLLGHFHGRSVGSVPHERVNPDHYPLMFHPGSGPLYIGATERKAWGEAANPTGAAIYEGGALTFMDHKTRDWLDLTADATTYQDVVSEAMAGRDDEPIVRLTVLASREEYRSIDELAAHRIAANALDLTIRRYPTEEEATAPTEPVDFHLTRDWREQVKTASLPKGVKRGDVEQAGIDALTSVGVAA